MFQGDHLYNMETSFYKPISQARDKSAWDAIVVGSGMGGMACAAALSKMGKRVLVLEQHYVPGGFTHTFSRKGYTWDVGVHCVGQMKDYELPGKILKWLTNGSLKMASMGPVYETFHFPGGFSVEFPDKKEGFRAALLEKFPEERKAIDAYFELVRKVSRESKTYFALKIMPGFLARLLTPFFSRQLKWWKTTTHEILVGLTANERLRTVLTAQWGYYGSTPKHSSFAIHALVTKHFWNGGYYPEGGSGRIAETLLQTVKDSGGESYVRADVQEILLDENRKACGVRLKTGQEFFASTVISAAGSRLTAQKLLPPSESEKPWSKSIQALPQSPPHLCLYLGFEGNIVGAGATPSNQWFMESWDMEKAYWEIDEAESEASVLYMSFPTLKDPQHIPGPTQRHTGEVVTFVPWHTFEKWRNTRRGLRDPEYLAFKKQIEDRMIAQLRKRIPKLMALVKYHELSTPLSTVHFTKAPEGAIYGLEPTPKRFANPWLRPKTPINGLYLTGGDVATLGVTGALMGGIMTAACIDRRIARRLK